MNINENGIPITSMINKHIKYLIKLNKDNQLVIYENDLKKSFQKK
jgi:hypothetical protein